MTNIRSPRRASAIGNGLLVALCDSAFVTAGAAMLWLNGRTSVIDPPLAALVVTVLICAFLVAVRRGVVLRRRDRTTPAAVLAERTTVIAQLVVLAALVSAWLITGVYELGWASAFASAALVVANALLLLSDVTTRSYRDASRQGRLHARRLASIEVLHITGALAGVGGIAATRSIHLWRSDILNGSILVVAIAVGIGCAASALLGVALSRGQVPSPAEAPLVDGRRT